MDPSAQLVCTFFVGALCAAIVTAIAMHRRAADVRRDALDRSRSVLRGQVSEQLAPLLVDFPWDPGDARFLGAPIDYVVFDGLCADEELELVFVEVKTGQARLTRREAAVRDAIEAGRVRFETLRIN